MSKEDASTEGVRQAWGYWLLEHTPVTVPQIIEDAIKEAVAAWLEGHGAQIVENMTRGEVEQGRFPENTPKRKCSDSLPNRQKVQPSRWNLFPHKEKCRKDICRMVWTRSVQMPYRPVRQMDPGDMVRAPGARRSRPRGS
jgi:hypothetical protein